MKKLIVLILIGYSVLLNAQTPFNVRGELKQIYKVGGTNDTTIQKFSADSALWLSTKPIFKFSKRVYAPLFFSSGDTVATRPWVRSLIGNETDPVWTNAQPYYVNRVELGDTARAIRDDFPTGGGGFASDGVYMDGDTVKLGRELLLNESLSDHFGINNDGIGGYMNVEGFPGGASWVGYNDNQTNYHLQIDQFGVGINSYGDLVNPNLRIDTTGIHYITSPDTTFTTPNHLMTEAQTKREIAAAREWISNGEAINYNYGGRTVVNIGNAGSISVYDEITNYESILTGNEVIVGDAFLYRDGSMRLKVIDCSLTDGSPTQVELSNCAGSASMAGQIKLIKDNTTSETYQIIATGTNWMYIKYTTP